MKLYLTFLVLLSSTLSAVDFTKDVRPILSEYCFSCHGPDEHDREGKLRLDTAEGETGAFRVRKNRVGILPGKPDKSHVYLRMITDDEDDIMPPLDTKKKMKPEEIAIIKKWISQGAEYDEHWAFKVPKKQELPNVKNSNRVRNDIDSFVLAELEKNDFKIPAEASKNTLLRRLYLDLTGFPPTLEEMKAFENGQTTYEKVVDKLLKSPHHAERLAVEWMDVARYADTNGYSIDDHRDMWAWRDWVIHAYLNNMNYKEFITQQIAGDFLVKSKPQPVSLESPSWIWKKGAIKTEKVNFKKTFKVAGNVSKALMQATCDNECKIIINGKEAAVSKHWQNEVISIDVAKYLKKGNNEILVEAVNEGSMAGFLFHLKIGKQIIKSDKSWQAQVPKKKWQGVAVLKPHGAAPWGKLFKLKEAPKMTAQEMEDLQKLVATGFLRNSMNTHEGGTIAEEYRVQYHVDKVDTVSTGVLGLTVKCAQCHDHKYDPISKEDFYKMFAFFNSSSEPGKGATNGNTKPFISVNSPLTSKESMIEQYKERIAELERIKKSIDPKSKINGFSSGLTIKSIDEEIKVIQRQINSGMTTVMVMDHRPNIKTHILDRGQYNKPTKEVIAGGLDKILPWKEEYPKNRLGLAKWIFDEKNPLTARVAVNRYWKILFGNGIVRSSEDFGSQGELPSHPELLDHLAVSFRADNWNVRNLIKKIVMSSTYRFSSKANDAYASKDPYNRLMWRAPTFRLEAEFVRDNALAISGALSTGIGGPGVFPKQPNGLWAQVSHFGYGRPFTAQTYFESFGKNLYRRSLYTITKRTATNPTMAAFDSPTREVCTVRRQQTNTPLQSLVVMNDPQFVNAARFLALKMKAVSGTKQRIALAFQSSTGRTPNEIELKILSDGFQEQKQFYENNSAKIKQLLLRDGDAEDAALVMIASTILNLSETMTRN